MRNGRNKLMTLTEADTEHIYDMTYFQEENDEDLKGE